MGFQTSSVSPGNSGSTPITKPSGTVQNDLLVAIITYEGGTNQTVTAPSGWTKVRTDGGATDIAQDVWYKVAGGSEPANYSWNVSAAAIWSIIIARYNSISTNNPIGANNGQKNASSTSIAAPGITTTGNNSIVIGCFGIDGTIESSFTVASGMTSRASCGLGGTGPTEMSLEDQLYATPTSTGTKTATANSTAAVNVGQLIELNALTQTIPPLLPILGVG